jgi:hypothetical protein
MHSLGFTGTRHLTADSKGLVLDAIGERLPEFDRFVTGGCNGFDAEMGRFLYGHFPNKLHYVIVPDNKGQVDWWFKGLPGVMIKYMPPGSSYRQRDQAIVDASDELFYCAQYPESDPRSQRSGTWLTKRLAVRAGVPVSGIVLNHLTD